MELYRAGRFPHLLCPGAVIFTAREVDPEEWAFIEGSMLTILGVGCVRFLTQGCSVDFGREDSFIRLGRLV